MAISLGFLSVRHHVDHGYFGGYLVVSHLGRPLEFHCTLPVKPTRAQVLLFGPTIDDFICGEQIGKALITKARLTPDLILTDTEAVLAASLVSDATIVCLKDTQQPENRYLRFPSGTNLCTRRFTVGGHSALALQDCHRAETIAAEVLSQASERFDITEPFSRIIEALFEAHPMITAAA